MLKHHITAETPFGGEGTDSKWAKQLLAELADGLEADAGEPKPRATGFNLDEIVADYFDYLHHKAFSWCRRRSR